MSTLITLVILGLVARTFWNRRSGGGLEDILTRCEAQGIISADQHVRILEQARADGGGVHLSGATWLAIIAGLFVVAGVSLLVASNWENIGPVVRVGAFLAAFALVGELAIRYRERSFAVAVPLELLWFFLPLLGIGLYGQTFQLSGDPVRPFLVWLALGLPIVWLSARPVVPTVHTIALVTVLFTGNFAMRNMLSLARWHGELGTASPVVAWTLTLVILAVVGLQSLRLLPHGHRRHFFAVLAAWVFGLLASPTPFELDHAGWLTVAGISLATLWLVAQLATNGSTPERLTGTLVWLATIYAATFFWHTGSSSDAVKTTWGMVVTSIALAGAIGGALLLPRGRLSTDGTWHTVGKLLLAAPALTATLLLVDDAEAIRAAAVIMNLLLVTIAVALMWHGSLAHDIAQINLGILVLLVVLVTRFLDVFGSLFTGGIGFIVAGMLLAALAYLLDRTRRRLIRLPEGTSA